MIENLLKNFNKKHKFLTKEKLYSFHQLVLDSLNRGETDKGVWTKAFADANGDPQKTQAIYIKLMVERMVEAEAITIEEAKKVQQEENNRKREAEYLNKKRKAEYINKQKRDKHIDEIKNVIEKRNAFNKNRPFSHKLIDNIIYALLGIFIIITIVVLLL